MTETEARLLLLAIIIVAAGVGIVVGSRWVR